MMMVMMTTTIILIIVINVTNLFQTHENKFSLDNSKLARLNFPCK
jgi:hypothetical protein